MGGYIGAKTGTLVASASDIRGDISATDTTPEITLKNTTETDADGTRSGKITFKGEQSGGEESVLAQIQGSHDGTADDEKGDLIFKTNDGSDGASPTTAMIIDSAQNVGINATPKATHADADVVRFGGTGYLANWEDAEVYLSENMYQDTSGNYKYLTASHASLYSQTTGKHQFRIAGSGSADGAITFTTPLEIDNNGKTTLTNTSAGASTTPFVLHNASSSANTDVRMLLAPCTTAADRPVILAATNNGSNVCHFTVSTPNGGTPVERLRVDGAGNVFIGKTGEVSTQDGFQFKQSGECLIGRGSNDTVFVFQDINSSGATVGSISITSSNTAYNTSSDYRLKENVTDISDGITRVKQLSPKRFNFIVNPDTEIVDGFIAHEVATVIPEAITGEKDAVDDDGNIKPQGIDQSKLVPLLTAALQEAIAKIETLETKVAALEAE